MAGSMPSIQCLMQNRQPTHLRTGHMDSGSPLSSIRETKVEHISCHAGPCKTEAAIEATLQCSCSYKR